MNPSIWGPPTWFFLHTLAFNYPENPSEKNKEDYQEFFESFTEVLPCEKCKKHFTKNMKDYPIQLESREELSNWLIFMHNEVNELNNKPLWNYDQVFEKYNDIYNPKNKSLSNTQTKKHYKISKIIFTICIILIIILYFSRSK